MLLTNMLKKYAILVETVNHIVIRLKIDIHMSAAVLNLPSAQIMMTGLQLSLSQTYTATALRPLPRPNFKTIAEVAEESQLGFAFGRRLVGDWSATNRGLVAD